MITSRKENRFILLSGNLIKYSIKHVILRNFMFLGREIDYKNDNT